MSIEWNAQISDRVRNLFAKFITGLCTCQIINCWLWWILVPNYQSLQVIQLIWIDELPFISKLSYIYKDLTSPCECKSVVDLDQTQCLAWLYEGAIWMKRKCWEIYKQYKFSLSSFFLNFYSYFIYKWSLRFLFVYIRLYKNSPWMNSITTLLTRWGVKDKK